MPDYYAERLAADKLRRCYEIAPQRVQQYLRAELEFALGFIHASNGFIACKDGFTATTLSAERFRTLAAGLPATLTLSEVDGSSLFCIFRKNGGW